VSRISDENERGRVLNEVWSRCNAVNFAAGAATLLTWRLGGLKADGELRAPFLMRLKNLLLGGHQRDSLRHSRGQDHKPVLLGRYAGRVGDSARGRDPRVGGPIPAPDLADRRLRPGLLVGAIAISAVIEASAVKPRGILSRLLT